MPKWVLWADISALQNLIAEYLQFRGGDRAAPQFVNGNARR